MTETPRWPRRRLLAGIFAAVMLLAGIAVGSWELQRATRARADRERIEALEDTAAESDAERDAVAAGLDDARSQLEAEGIEPAVPPAEEIVEDAEEALRGQPGEPGERGETGPGPSDAQVAQAVETYCAINGCQGPRGPEPSAFQVAAAVVSYCDARGQCAGPPGSDGADGTDGVDGATGTPGEPGEQGPPPTDDQIAAAVESFCALRDGCRGPAGTDGEDSTVPGPAGPAGPPGPTCPNGAPPISWTVDAARSATTGLDAGTYLVCRST